MKLYIMTDAFRHFLPSAPFDSTEADKYSTVPEAVLLFHPGLCLECSGWGVTGKQGVPTLPSLRSRPLKSS